jgi:hypothetical protein
MFKKNNGCLNVESVPFKFQRPIMCKNKEERKGKKRFIALNNLCTKKIKSQLEFLG